MEKGIMKEGMQQLGIHKIHKKFLGISNESNITTFRSSNTYKTTSLDRYEHDTHMYEN